MSKTPELKNPSESSQPGELQVRPGLLKRLKGHARDGGRGKMQTKMELNAVPPPVRPHPGMLASLYSVSGLRPLKTAGAKKTPTKAEDQIEH